jgi:hypothetical protein
LCETKDVSGKSNISAQAWDGERKLQHQTRLKKKRIWTKSCPARLARRTKQQAREKNKPASSHTLSANEKALGSGVSQRTKKTAEDKKKRILGGTSQRSERWQEWALGKKLDRRDSNKLRTKVTEQKIIAEESCSGGRIEHEINWRKPRVGARSWCDGNRRRPKRTSTTKKNRDPTEGETEAILKSKSRFEEKKTGARKKIGAGETAPRQMKTTSGNLIRRRMRGTSGKYRNQIQTNNTSSSQIGSPRSRKAKRKTEKHKPTAKNDFFIKI